MVKRAVLIVSGEGIFLTAQEEGGEGANLFLGEVQVGHAELLKRGLDLALVPDVWFSQFVLEKPFVVVPGGFGGALGQAGEVVRIRDGFAAAAGGHVREQGE